MQAVHGKLIKNKISTWKYIPVDKQEFLLYKRCNYPPKEGTPVFS